jgi:Fe-S-cluster containining protein
MKCKVCRGACCEIFELGPLELRLSDRDHRYWLELHTLEIEPVLIFECKCQKLTSDGRCGIYESRPKMCADFPPGCPSCLKVVKERRTPEDYQLIRDAQDPEKL